MPDQPSRDHSVSPRSRAELAESGVSPGQLRGPRWRRVAPDRHLPAQVDVAGAGQRIAIAASRLPDGAAIGGWAAGWWLGAGQCDGLATDGRTALALPCVLGPGNLTRTVPGYELWFDRLPDDDVTVVHGVPVTTAARTCFDGVRRAADIVEAVVFADQMLHAGLVSIVAMREYVARRGGWRGVPQARRALDLADPMARNGWETRMRMVWMLDAGLPRPLCNPPLFDLHAGLLGYPDLLDPEAGTVGEFDGADHRRLRRHTDDNAREETFEDARLVVTRATSLDLGRRQPLARRMQRAHARGRARDRRRDRWTLEVPSDWGPDGAEDELNALLDGADERWTPPW